VYTAEGWQALCQLTGLRHLSVELSDSDSYTPVLAAKGNLKGPLQQLTQLKHLTALKFSGGFHRIELTCAVSWSTGVYCFWLYSCLRPRRVFLSAELTAQGLIAFCSI
jgi:hypothetical protein